MIERLKEIIFVVIFLFFVAGFGIKTEVFPRSEETVLVSEYGEVEGSSAIRHVATVRCVAEKASSATYLKDIDELKQGNSPVHLSGDAEAISYKEALKLIGDEKGKVDFDPGCQEGNYIHHSVSLIGFFLWRNML